jgi:hypothetical protein
MVAASASVALLYSSFSVAADEPMGDTLAEKRGQGGGERGGRRRRWCRNGELWLHRLACAELCCG